MSPPPTEPAIVCLDAKPGAAREALVRIGARRYPLGSLEGCRVGAEEGTGLVGNLTCCVLFLAAALALAEGVVSHTWQPKFLFAVALAAGVALVALQDAWLQRGPGVWRLYVTTAAGEETALTSPDRKRIERAARELESVLAAAHGTSPGRRGAGRGPGLASGAQTLV